MFICDDCSDGMQHHERHQVIVCCPDDVTYRVDLCKRCAFKFLGGTGQLGSSGPIGSLKHLLRRVGGALGVSGRR